LQDFHLSGMGREDQDQEACLHRGEYLITTWALLCRGILYAQGNIYVMVLQMEFGFLMDTAYVPSEHKLSNVNPGAFCSPYTITWCGCFT